MAAMEARADVRWLDVWTRAVVLPAGRRASAIWLGSAIVAAVLFGPTGLHASDVTGLALHHPGVAGTLAGTWILMFAPTARMLLRADGASYLRSLPGPRIAPAAIIAGALVIFQAPWVALWIIGDGLRGLAIVLALSIVIVALARWRPPRVRARWPNWKHAGSALRSLHLRALRRRAGDALVRGVGLAVLAGVTAGLFVKNNGLHEQAAAVMGASVIAVVLVPATVGLLMVILGAYRETAWLAATLGLTQAIRVRAVIYALVVVHVLGSALAIGAVKLVADLSGRDLAWVAATSLVVALGSALGCARVLLGKEDSPSMATRAVVGAIVVASAAVFWLGLFGVVGLAAFAATMLFAVFTLPRPEAQWRS